MAKITYLEHTNRLLRRIGKSDVATLTASTGITTIAKNFVNEAQIDLFNETDWYSLYSERTFATVADTATYDLASDFGRAIILCDTTNNRWLVEEGIRIIAASDPDRDNTGIPRFFTIEDGNYRLYEIPNGAYTIRDYYWKFPTALSADASTSDLPEEAQNLITLRAYYHLCLHLNSFEKADRINLEYERSLVKVKRTNRRKIDRLNVFAGSSRNNFGIQPPRFPSTYQQPF